MMTLTEWQKPFSCFFLGYSSNPLLRPSYSSWLQFTCEVYLRRWECCSRRSSCLCLFFLTKDSERSSESNLVAKGYKTYYYSACCFALIQIWKDSMIQNVLIASPFFLIYIYIWCEGWIMFANVHLTTSCIIAIHLKSNLSVIRIYTIFVKTVTPETMRAFRMYMFIVLVTTSKLPQICASSMVKTFWNWAWVT